MNEPHELTNSRKETIGGSLTFGLPQAIVVALLSIVIATAVAVANS